MPTVGRIALMATTPFLSWGPLERLPCLSHSVWPQPHPFCSSGSCVPFCFPSASHVFISPGHTPHRGENGITTLVETGRESKKKEGKGKGRGERKGTLSLPGLTPQTELWELKLVQGRSHVRCSHVTCLWLQHFGIVPLAWVRDDLS